MKAFLPLLAGSFVLAGCNLVVDEDDILLKLPPRLDTLGPDTVTMVGDQPGFSSVNGQEIFLTERPDFKAGDFDQYVDTATGQEQFVYYATTEDRLAAVMVIGTNTSANPAGSVTYFTDVDSTMPITGSATYTGSYAGILAGSSVEDEVNNNTHFLMSGDVSLRADFAALEVSGVVTNRRARHRNSDNNAGDFGDITIAAAPIGVDGTFTGTTSGGRLLQADWTATDGAVQGIFVGPRAESALGGIRLNHKDQGIQMHTELGAFIVEK